MKIIDLHAYNLWLLNMNDIRSNILICFTSPHLKLLACHYTIIPMPALLHRSAYIQHTTTNQMICLNKDYLQNLLTKELPRQPKQSAKFIRQNYNLITIVQTTITSILMTYTRLPYTVYLKHPTCLVFTLKWSE